MLLVWDFCQHYNYEGNVLYKYLIFVIILILSIQPKNALYVCVCSNQWHITNWPHIITTSKRHYNGIVRIIFTRSFNQFQIIYSIKSKDSWVVDYYTTHLVIYFSVLVNLVQLYIVASFPTLYKRETHSKVDIRS